MDILGLELVDTAALEFLVILASPEHQEMRLLQGILVILVFQGIVEFPAIQDQE